jgi:hypothetical protein
LENERGLFDGRRAHRSLDQLAETVDGSGSASQLERLEGLGRISVLGGERTRFARKMSEFVDRYISRLDPETGDVVRRVAQEGTQWTSVAEDLGIKERGARYRIVRAMRAFILEVAKDDPDWSPVKTGKRGRPPRDYDAEAKAAHRVFVRYLVDEDLLGSVR